MLLDAAFTLKPKCALEPASNEVALKSQTSKNVITERSSQEHRVHTCNLTQDELMTHGG